MLLQLVGSSSKCVLANNHLCIVDPPTPVSLQAKPTLETVVRPSTSRIHHAKQACRLPCCKYSFLTVEGTTDNPVSPTETWWCVLVTVSHSTLSSSGYITSSVHQFPQPWRLPALPGLLQTHISSFITISSLLNPVHNFN